MELQSNFLSKYKSNFRLRPKDQTILWSHHARRKHRYNRMDPDPDPRNDTSSTPSLPNTVRDRDGKIKLTLTKEDWKRFWADRLRKLVDAPHLTDKDLTDAVERSRRIFLHHREENRKVRIDPDIPPCFYWNQYEVANWVQSVGLSEAVKEMFLHFGISGRELITLDANTLLKMGLYELGTIKKVTKAVRNVLGLPHTNGLRAMARVPPLETFLRLKVRTGSQVDKFSFKEYCAEQRIEYEPVLQQMSEGYQPIPGCCRVEILPGPKEEIKWIPIKVSMANKKKRSDLSAESESQQSDSGLSAKSSEDLFLHQIPTVEELATNALMRNTFIPPILNEIIQAVFEKVKENRRNECIKNKQQLANQIFLNQLDKAYEDFHIVRAEDKLKFVTIIAEELVEDVLRAREILEDIDKFQERIKSELPPEDIKNMQKAVAHYVQSIMPVVVSAALKEMEKSSTEFHCELTENNSGYYADDGENNASTQNAFEAKSKAEEKSGEDFEVIWDRTFIEDLKPSPPLT